MTQVYDFSSSEKRLKFIKALDDPKTWNDPLPSVEWISHTQFVKGGFFRYSGWYMFTRAFGGRDRLANKEDLPPNWKHADERHYARCFIIEDMVGYIMLPDSKHKKTDFYEQPYVGFIGKLHIGQFRFCVHDMKTQNLGKCLNRYTCTKCGFIHTEDSGD